MIFFYLGLIHMTYRKSITTLSIIIFVADEFALNIILVLRRTFLWALGNPLGVATFPACNHPSTHSQTHSKTLIFGKWRIFLGQELPVHCEFFLLFKKWIYHIFLHSDFHFPDLKVWQTQRISYLLQSLLVSCRDPKQVQCRNT